MNRRLTSLLLPLLILTATTVAIAAAADTPLTTWHKAARALTPGATLEIPDGTYTTTGSLKIEGLHGTAEKPITLRAAHRGQAIISGTAGFVIRDCQHLTLEGFTMTHDADQQAFILFNCQHVRVTRCTFRLTERAKPRHWEHWVTIDGTASSHNRIDHNLFEKKVNRGSPVFVRGDDPTLVCSQHDRVDHNHFRDQPYANKENGHETIRTGGNDLGASDRSSFTVIEDNLLERCSGEDEIISIKSSDNILRNNTLINCRGAICMRLGNRSTISGNFIIATEDGPAFGGIKLYGFEHRVFNNYCFGLTGRHHEAPFILDPGTLDTPATENIRDKYDDSTSVAPTRCWIAHNTFIDCSPLQFGYPDKKRPCIPTDNTFIHNLVVRTGTSVRPQVTAAPGTKSRPIPLINLDRVRGIHATGNLAYDAPAMPVPQSNSGSNPNSKSAATSPPSSALSASTEGSPWFHFADPQLHLVENKDQPALWRLTHSLPAPETATTATRPPADTATVLNEDIFAQPRTPAISHDIGAEQFTAPPLTSTLPLRRPLTPADVGPQAP